MSLTPFKALFCGVGNIIAVPSDLFMSDAQEHTQKPSEDRALRVCGRFLEYVRPHKRLFVVAFVGMVVFSASNTGFAMLMKELLDGGAINEGVIPRWIPLALLAVLVVRGTGYFLSTYCMGVINSRAARAVRTDLFVQMLHLPVSFYEGFDKAKMLSRLTHVVSSVSDNMTRTVTSLIRDSLMLLFLLAWMVYLNWILSLVFFLAVPIVLRVVKSGSRRVKHLSKMSFGSMADLTAVADQSLRGDEVVKSFVGQAYMRERFEETNESVADYMRRMIKVKASSAPLAMLGTGVGISLVIFLFTLEGFAQWITIGELVSFLVSAMMVPRPVKSLVNLNVMMQAAISGMRLILEVLDVEAEPTAPSVAAKPTDELKGDIVFENVSMNYEGGGDGGRAVSSVSFRAEAGRRVAVVGRSGAGKSTLVRLLMRFYEPDAGRILIGGKDIAGMDLHALRHAVAYAPQQAVLFNDTIANNIACSRDADADRVREAARMAHVLEFAEALPEGLETQVGRGGRSLSGGQRQRVALARCLYKDAPVVVFDEATSALDSESEDLIKDAVRETLKGRTCLIIAHRFSTIYDADAVVVLESGRVVQTGTHDELVETDGVYRTLYRKGEAGLRA